MIICPNLFCPDKLFENKIVSLLNKCLFYPALTLLPKTAVHVKSLHDIYEDMRLNCDYPDIDKKYMVNGSCIKVNRKGLEEKGFVFAGFDLPIWINTPNTVTESANCRIMIVGLDARRKRIDMYETSPTRDQLMIYSPFAMHCRYHRRKEMVIPYMTKEILNCANHCYKTISLYITDFYKFKLADNPAIINNANKNIYEDAYKDEIEVIKPNVVILLGKRVMNAVGVPATAPYFKITIVDGIKYLPIPHPSGNNIKEINKALCTIGRNKDEPKIAITKEVCRILKNICSKTSI